MSIYESVLFRNYPELRGIPGPAPSFPLGSLSEFASRSAWDVSTDLYRSYGPYVLLWLANQPLVLVHDPATIHEILDSKKEAFYKDEPTGAMAPGAGSHNPFIANDTTWARAKSASFFEDQRFPTWMKDQFASSQEYLRGKITHALPLITSHFEDWLYRVVFDFNAQMIFGRELSSQDFDRYNHQMDVLDFRMKSNLPLLPPTFKKARREWLASLEKIVRENANDPHGQSMSHLLSRQSGLPREHLVHALADVFPGGVYSITAAIAHILGLIHDHGVVWEQLRAELSKLNANTQVSYQDLRACTLLEQCVREGLRLYSPAPVFMRRVKAPMAEVGAVRLPKGTRVMIGSMPLQHDSAYWQNAESFMPERWTQEVLAANPYGSGYFFPFGRGPRTCGGQQLALYMIRSVLFQLIADTSLEMVISTPKKHRFYFGCMMPDGMPADIRRYKAR